MRGTETSEAVTLLHTLPASLTRGRVGTRVGLELTRGAFKVVGTLAADLLYESGRVEDDVPYLGDDSFLFDLHFAGADSAVLLSPFLFLLSCFRKGPGVFLSHQ